MMRLIAWLQSNTSHLRQPAIRCVCSVYSSIAEFTLNSNSGAGGGGSDDGTTWNAINTINFRLVCACVCARQAFSFYDSAILISINGDFIANRMDLIVVISQQHDIHLNAWLQRLVGRIESIPFVVYTN